MVSFTKITLAVLGMYVFSFTALGAQKKCNIFIHGYTASSEGYFGDLPRQVIWESNNIIHRSAPEVAKKILEQIETCEDDSLVVLRPHSYGAAQVLYILGQGKRFQDFFPNHDFVKVYKNTHEVYAYTGAYHGTPIMDIVCSSRITKFIGDYFGRSCVPTLTTSTISDVSSFVHSPGVPTYLVYSSNRSGYFGTIGAIIAQHMLSIFEFILKGKRNQNDNTLPIYATRACADVGPLLEKDANCKKLDPNYFIDFYHTEKYHHTSFLKNKDFMLMENSEGESE